MRQWYFFILVFFLFSCKKDEIGPQCPGCIEDVSSSTTDVLIGCEGNFGWGNASLSKYAPNTQNVSQQVFQNINGFNLGDVLQSFCSYNNKLYIVMNNSGKIQIIDTANYTYLNTISGLNSPRYMVTSGTLGYVSDLYSNGISVIDLSVNQVIDTIQVGRWSEYLLVESNDLYISCPDTNWVLKYDLSTNQYLDTIIVGKSPGKMVIDNNGHIWMLCSGGYLEEIPKLIAYDGVNIIQTLSFNSINDNPSQLSYDATKDELYFLNDGVFSTSTNTGSLPSTAIISSNGSVFYGLAIDPHNSELYVTDAIDYVQPGRVLRFDSLYSPIDTFSTGIIPQAIWFK